MKIKYLFMYSIWHLKYCTNYIGRVGIYLFFVMKTIFLLAINSLNTTYHGMAWLQKWAWTKLRYTFYKWCKNDAFEFISKYSDTIISNDTITCFGFVLFLQQGYSYDKRLSIK